VPYALPIGLTPGIAPNDPPGSLAASDHDAVAGDLLASVLRARWVMFAEAIGKEMAQWPVVG